MKRLYAGALAAAFLMLCLSACSTQDADNKPKDDVSMGAVESAIKAQVKSDLISSGAFQESDFEEGVLPSYQSVKLNEEGFQLPIEADVSQLEDAVAISHMMNVNADMIVVLKAKDAEGVKKAEEIAKQLKEQQVQTWEQYLPEQFDKVQSNITKTVGNFVLYITYDDPKRMEDAIMKVIR